MIIKCTKAVGLPHCAPSAPCTRHGVTKAKDESGASNHHTSGGGVGGRGRVTQTGQKVGLP